MLQYAPPQLTDLPMPQSSDSNGGDEMTFVGVNFGPPDAPLQLYLVRPNNVAYQCNVTVC